MRIWPEFPRAERLAHLSPFSIGGRHGSRFSSVLNFGFLGGALAADREQHLALALDTLARFLLCGRGGADCFSLGAAFKRVHQLMSCA